MTIQRKLKTLQKLIFSY